MKAIEADMFGNAHPAPDRVTGKLLQTFTRLGLSDIHWGMPLEVQSLDATLKSVSFDDSKIKLWKNNEDK